jgi:hypothetical protein
MLAFAREDGERAEAYRAVQEGYATSTSVTPCVTQFTSSIFTRWVGDGLLLQALGGDCDIFPPSASWSRIAPVVSHPFQSTAVDVLGNYVYVGLTSAPYFAIKKIESGDGVAFNNNFVLPAMPNALDAALVGGHPYVFAALATSTGQFAVINASDPQNPTVVTRSLAGIKTEGADPAAYHVTYFDEHAYVTIRYVIGPQAELHIFDVSHPESAIELGTANLETTVNAMVLRHMGSSTLLYAATTHDSKELAVYDVTHPGNVSPTPVVLVDLPGSQDGESLAIASSRLYFGRASNTAGPELYVFDISSMTPVLVGSAEVASKDITGIALSGSLAFIAATASGVSTRVLEVWDVSSTSMRLISSLKDAGLAPGGIDYANDMLYAVGATFLIAHGD